MLYVFYGTDDVRSRERMHVTLAALQKRAPEAAVTRVSEEDMETVRMDDLLAIQGLFYNKRIVIFDKALSADGHGLGSKEKKRAVVERMKEMGESDHVFLVLEGVVDADFEKKLAKHANKMEMSGSAKREKKEERPDWSITNALEKGDGRAMWVSLHRAFLKENAPEMIHGQLFWKAKQILFKDDNVASRTYFKKILAELAELPHVARRRGMDLAYALEKFALGVRPQDMNKVGLRKGF